MWKHIASELDAALGRVPQAKQLAVCRLVCLLLSSFVKYDKASKVVRYFNRSCATFREAQKLESQMEQRLEKPPRESRVQTKNCAKSYCKR